MDLRFKDRASSAYREAVFQRAERLSEATETMEVADLGAAAVAVEHEVLGEIDDEPGFIDAVAASEEAMPRWSETMDKISDAQGKINEVTEKAAADMQRADAQGKGFAGRLTISRRVAAELLPLVGVIEDEGSKFSADLYKVDTGIRLLLHRMPEEIDDPTALREVCQFLSSITFLGASTRKAMDTLEQMVGTIAPLEALSRDLRPPLRRLRMALTKMIEARNLAVEWLGVIDGLEIDCSSVDGLL